MSMFNLETKFSDGLGFLPISLFVGLNGVLDDHIELYNKIISEEINDIIFSGKMKENYDQLKWVISRLRFDGMLISVVSHDIIRLPAQRYILIVDTLQPSVEKLVQRMDDNDIVLFNIDNLGGLNLVRNWLIKYEIGCKLLFNEDKLDRSKVLENRILDVVPCKLCI